jgi:molybdopterin-synthase adenylyltransferase
MDERYVRHEGLFGAGGQEKLARTRVGIAGTGGLGCFVSLELAYLGVSLQTLVDADDVELRNLNRLVWATPADIGRLKVDVTAEMVSRILPGTDPVKVPHALEHPDAQAALAEVDVIFSCLDDDHARVNLIALATAAGIPFFDLATDVIPEPGKVPTFGGRIIFSGHGERCAYCMRELDQAEIRRATMTPQELTVEASIYGVPVSALTRSSGPSVVSLNGVIASLAVTEFIKFITGLLTPAPMLRYNGNTSSVRRVLDAPSIVPCPYCAAWGRLRRGQLRA